VLDKGSIVIGGYKAESLMQSIEIALELFNDSDKRPVDYRDIDVSAKVVRIIQSYTSIVNKMTWDKF
jgi:hypothetical protein